MKNEANRLDANLRSRLKNFILKVGNLSPQQMRDIGIDPCEWNDLLTKLEKDKN